MNIFGINLAQVTTDFVNSFFHSIGLTPTVVIIIGNVFGFLGGGMMALLGLFKKKKNIIIGQTIQCILMTISNLVLGGISGALVDFVQVFRGIFEYKKKTTTAVKIVIIVLIVGLNILFGVNDIIMWFPVIASCVLTWFYDSKNVILLKSLIGGGQLLWAIFDLSILNFAPLVFDLISVVTTIISLVVIIREKVRDRKAAGENEAGAVTESENATETSAEIETVAETEKQ